MGANAEPWRNDPECLHESWEWRCILQTSGKQSEKIEVLCCPEDVEYCCEDHERTHTVCGACSIAVCAECLSYLHHARSNENFSS